MLEYRRQTVRYQDNRQERQIKAKKGEAMKCVLV